MVRCKPLKEAMAAAASQLADGLLEHVRATLKASSVDIGDNCAAMAAEVRGAWGLQWPVCSHSCTSPGNCGLIYCKGLHMAAHADDDAACIVLCVPRACYSYTLCLPACLPAWRSWPSPAAAAPTCWPSRSL